MKFLDPHDPFFKPLWVRLLTTLVPIFFSGLEFWQGSLTFAFLFLAMGFYAGLTFWFARGGPKD